MIHENNLGNVQFSWLAKVNTRENWRSPWLDVFFRLMYGIWHNRLTYYCYDLYEEIWTTLDQMILFKRILALILRCQVIFYKQLIAPHSWFQPNYMQLLSNIWESLNVIFWRVFSDLFTTMIKERTYRKISLVSLFKTTDYHSCLFQ